MRHGRMVGIVQATDGSHKDEVLAMIIAGTLPAEGP